MFFTLLVLLRKMRDDSRAVTALEYGLIASLIAVAIVASITALGTHISDTFNTITNSL